MVSSFPRLARSWNCLGEVKEVTFLSLTTLVTSMPAFETIGLGRAAFLDVADDHTLGVGGEAELLGQLGSQLLDLEAEAI